MWKLGARLRRGGYHVVTFFHCPWCGSLDDKASALRAKVVALDSRVVHFVAHSMGGLIVLRMMSHDTSGMPGRVILLGSPVNGSSVARTLAGSALGRRLLGRCMLEARDGVSALPPDHEMGALAGRKAIGMGRLFGVVKPCDGAVRVDETLRGDLTDHCVVAASHTGMLFSRHVVDLVGRFLRAGTFRGDLSDP